MAYDEKQKLPAKPHTIAMDNRAALAVSGVEDVESFDENEIVIITAQGNLVVRGQGLHIEKISLDVGELKVGGLIYELCYEETAPSGSLWSRLFK